MGKAHSSLMDNSAARPRATTAPAVRGDWEQLYHKGGLWQRWLTRWRVLLQDLQPQSIAWILSYGSLSLHPSTGNVLCQDRQLGAMAVGPVVAAPHSMPGSGELLVPVMSCLSWTCNSSRVCSLRVCWKECGTAYGLWHTLTLWSKHQLLKSPWRVDIASSIPASLGLWKWSWLPLLGLWKSCWNWRNWLRKKRRPQAARQWSVSLNSCSWNETVGFVNAFVSQ